MRDELGGNGIGLVGERRGLRVKLVLGGAQRAGPRSKPLELRPRVVEQVARRRRFALGAVELVLLPQPRTRERGDTFLRTREPGLGRVDLRLGVGLAPGQVVELVREPLECLADLGRPCPEGACARRDVGQ